MAVHIVDITARLMVERDDVDPDTLCGDICSRIEEYLLKGETLIDIELQSITLPIDGTRDPGSRACPQENE